MPSVRPRALLDVVQQGQHGVAAAPGRAHFGAGPVEAHRGDPVARARGEEPERGRSREREVPLLTAGGAEVEAGGAVHDEPRLELAIRDRVAHVGDVGARGQAPVDPAGVVTRLIEPGVAGLAAGPAHVSLVVAVEQAVELAVDEEIELPERGLAPADLDTGHDATATSVARSNTGPSWLGVTRGAPTVLTIRVTTSSGVTPSASASYESRTRWRRTSRATSNTSRGIT